MSIIRDFRSFLLEEKFKITILKNKINISNYNTIDYFESNMIIIKYNEEEIIIKGDDLVVSKLMDNEILISGIIKNIEMR